jgi:anti-sigma factor RsiW
VHDHHHSPRCRELLAQLSEYIDGDLEGALCQEIEHHLASCHDCQVLVDTTRKTVALYRRHHRQTEAELSPEISERLWAALNTAGYPSNPPESDPG